MTTQLRIRVLVASMAAFVLVAGMFALRLQSLGAEQKKAEQKKAEPQPRVVDPGKPGQPPSDAVMLFNGKDLSNWVRRDGKPAQWTVEDGVITCKPGTGDIISKEKFGSVQLHLEFATPLMPEAKSQGRGNSGVYIQGRYEVQVLDSYKNETYANGSCGALYGQYAPLVNACRPPLEWQSYDIIFHAPKCDTSGKVTERGRLTILHNGVIIQDNVEIKSVSGGELDRKECEPGPLLLQDHGNLVKFRNIWYRPL